MSHSDAASRARVLVVGGGFGGLAVARGLASAPVDVLLVDRVNHHTFQPLLYQVATAALSPADIAAPIRHVLRKQKNAAVAMLNVERVDLAGRRVVSEKAGVQLRYDYLVLAAGARHAYFGNDAWQAHAPGLKTIDDALEIRRRVLLAFEEAELEETEAARQTALTFVVVGGGPTGVEMAGALREIAAKSIPTDFRRVDTSTARVVLVEAQDRLLLGMSEKAGARAAEDLRAMGVELRLQSRVTHVDEKGVVVVDAQGQQERIEASNVVWAAGVRASSLGASLGVELDRAGRVLVEADCSLPGHRNVFAIGDMASLTDPKTGQPVPGVAQGALQMGAHVARIIERALREQNAERPNFVYKDKGAMATIGRAKAVAEVGKRSFGGLTAWLLWCVIHVMFLVTFRNRVSVMLEWFYAYLGNVRGARLITGGVAPEVETIPADVVYRPDAAPAGAMPAERADS